MKIKNLLPFLQFYLLSSYFLMEKNMTSSSLKGLLLTLQFALKVNHVELRPLHLLHHQAPPQIQLQRFSCQEGSEHTVKMLNNGAGGQMIFEPAVLKVSLGDTIHFKATDAAHNSASIDGMVPNGADSWAGALSQDISVVMNTEGVYVYQCDPHVMMAMVGVIQVGEATNLDDIKASAADKKASFYAQF